MKKQHFGGVVSPSFLAVAGIYLLLFAFLYQSSFSVMIGQWSGADHSYCYLVPFIVLYLLWEKKTLLMENPSTPDWKGILPLVLGIFFYWVGELGGEYYTLYLSSWLMLTGICVLHMGMQKVRNIMFPLFFILTMFPLPSFFNNRITLALKLISSKLGVMMMQAWGMSAYREGNVIDLGFTRLQVVDACSGLRYLYPLLVMGILLAYFYKARWWKKLILVLSTVPLTIVTNSLRIALTGILSEIWGSKAVEGFFHDFEGWLIFMLTLGCLLGEMWILNKIFPEKNTDKTEPKPDGLHEKPATVDTPPKPWTDVLKQPQFMVAVVLMGATLLLSQGIEFREAVPINRPFAEFPMKVGDWTGTRKTMETKFIEALDFSDYVMADYKKKSGKTVDFYAAYYETQRKGESIHPPATCLRGGGWVFKQAGKVLIPVSGRNEKMLPVNRSLIQKGPVRQLSYYWYPSRGRILTNAYQMKWFNFWDALTRQRTDGALVRLITMIGPDEKITDAEQRLQQFLKDFKPLLADFLPGSTPIKSSKK
jgi:exosortase D (VPLPA-CTERM-specific)